MGTRLYPNTRNHRNLEILAQVPEGTAELYFAKEKEFGVDNESVRGLSFYENRDRQDKWYDFLFTNEHLDSFHAFLVYGWGKFDRHHIAEGYSGSLDDLNKISELFAANGIEADPHLTEGVHWC